MLRIHLGEFRDDCIVNPDGYFNIEKEKDWFNRQDIKDIIKEIDNSIAVKDEYIESPVYGGMAPERLSQGCKAVILLYINPLCNIYATRCGDNCFPAILRLAKRTDVVITLHHIPDFPEYFDAYIEDTKQMVHSYNEFVIEFSIVDGTMDESFRGMEF